jgi:hypothetical protein
MKEWHVNYGAWRNTTSLPRHPCDGRGPDKTAMGETLRLSTPCAIGNLDKTTCSEIELDWVPAFAGMTA